MNLQEPALARVVVGLANAAQLAAARTWSRNECRQKDLGRGDAAVYLHELVDHDLALHGHGGLDTAPVRPHQQSLLLGEHPLGCALCGTVTLQEQKNNISTPIKQWRMQGKTGQYCMNNPRMVGCDNTRVSRPSSAKVHSCKWEQKRENKTK